MTTRSERRVSVRLVATGGQALKAELVGVGQEGARALTLIEAAGPRAAAGLNAAGVSAGEAMRQMQDLADRAARAPAGRARGVGSQLQPAGREPAAVRVRRPRAAPAPCPSSPS